MYKKKALICHIYFFHFHNLTQKRFFVLRFHDVSSWLALEGLKNQSSKNVQKISFPQKHQLNIRTPRSLKTLKTFRTKTKRKRKNHKKTFKKLQKIIRKIIKKRHKHGKKSRTNYCTQHTLILQGKSRKFWQSQLMYAEGFSSMHVRKSFYYEAEQDVNYSYKRHLAFIFLRS